MNKKNGRWTCNPSFHSVIYWYILRAPLQYIVPREAFFGCKQQGKHRSSAHAWKLPYNLRLVSWTTIRLDWWLLHSTCSPFSSPWDTIEKCFITYPSVLLIIPWNFGHWIANIDRFWRSNCNRWCTGRRRRDHLVVLPNWKYLLDRWTWLVVAGKDRTSSTSFLWIAKKKDFSQHLELVMPSSD